MIRGRPLALVALVLGLFIGWARPILANESARSADAVAGLQDAVAANPEDPSAYFNLGSALYRADVFEEAAAAYETAAMLFESESARARAWYNMGNCVARLARDPRAEEPRLVASLCEQAAWRYRMALELDPDFEDAAYNLELIQRVREHAEEEARRREDDEKKQNDLLKHIREKLTEFIERQTALLKTEDTGASQAALRADVEKLATLIEASGLTADIPSSAGPTTPGPLKATWDHTVQAAEAMAVPDQPRALAELIAALGATPQDPNSSDDESDDYSEDEEYDMESSDSDQEATTYEEADPFGDFSSYSEIRGVPPPNKTEMDILAEEVRNQERRERKRKGGYKQVDKDW